MDNFTSREKLKNVHDREGLFNKEYNIIRQTSVFNSIKTSIIDIEL